MDMLDLKVFIAVAESKSMRKAAPYVALTQPAVSLRIAGLESELGVPLFSRTRSGAVLTEAGTKFYFYAQYALSALEAGREAITGPFPAQKDNKLRIGIVESLTHIMLPAILQFMKEQAPDIQWKISTGQSLDLTLRSVAGELDISFVNQVFTPLPQIRTVELFEEPLVFIGPKQAGFPRFHSLATYLREVPFILLKRQMPLRELLEHKLFIPQRIYPQKLIEVDTSHLVRQMVAQGGGCSFLPVSSLWPAGSHDAIDIIPLPEFRLKQSFYCAYPLSLSENILHLLPGLQALIRKQVEDYRNDSLFG
ncbi:LysR family transcriptional regulator [Paenibacillus physcomitrellae]|uniref:LysR family transcriptional regulator n=1 Tax=Paenibacillus physcomitrellae TaxID=1619311 RepID=A0ABQ1FZQ3_9BACL|nr:LysR family transcriptional regulator [Paenibacillus physcomitrellae]GGA33847.1 LysR family transcriptional regulator [Paenibacillus physcomitrellae]